MKKPIVAALVALSVALVVGVACDVEPNKPPDKGLVSDDEEPIQVKNASNTLKMESASMDVVTEDGVWAPDGTDEYTNDTTQKVHQKELWIAVLFTDPDAKCTASGNPVDIAYSDTRGSAEFKVKEGSGSNPHRTKVKLKGNAWSVADKKTLQYTSEGHISGVKIKNKDLPCQITKDNLKEIRICSSETQKKCQ
jgi:hypothetical protein